jgi:long-subunit acyl-CoA synthetase (AMP-forming)
MPATVDEALKRATDLWAAVPAFEDRQNGAWRSTSWKEYGALAHRVARGLMALGLEPGGGVSIIGSNRPEWIIADLGAILAGGVPAGIYATCSPEQCRYITDHCDAHVAVVEDAAQLDKFKQVRGELPKLKALVLMEGEDPDEDVLSWDELLAVGDKVGVDELEARKKAQKPGDLCTLIYTSGTTGPPKAVMISHENILWTAQTAVDHVGGMGPGDTQISYLPLSHVAEQMLTMYLPMMYGGTIYFERVLDNLGETLRAARPAVFLGVPRVWEKIQAKIMAVAAQNSWLKRRIGKWAKGVGLAGGLAEQQGNPKPLLYPLADRLVFSKVRSTLGLDRCKIALSSTAPINRDTLEFFLSLGVVICEIYGMSECTGPATICSPRRYRTGKAGYALPGAGVRIARDGEICIRGPNVFMGYLKDDAATAECLDEDGWLRSGDIGTLDGEGFLQVTDRKKELIITAGGKNVAPAVIEAALKSVPAISQAVVIGDRRKFLSALVTLDPERLADEARAAGLGDVTDPRSAADSVAFRAHILKLVEAASAGLSRVETVRKITILPQELSEEGGELTPTLKVKRRVINEKYADQIEAMYS